MTFAVEEDAKRVMVALQKRFERFGLKLHPEKTRIVPFQRPSRDQGSGKGPATFDFLGFTHYWVRARKGSWQPSMKTRSVRLRRAIQSAVGWCFRHRHDPIKEQHKALCRKIAGHFRYFGVNGNIRCLQQLVHATERVWLGALRRRSQRSKLTWKRFRSEILKRFPLPRPRIHIAIWASP